MDKKVACVDCWNVLLRRDGSYAVCDSHGMIEGPFGTEKEAVESAMRLPVARKAVGRMQAH